MDRPGRRWPLSTALLVVGVVIALSVPSGHRVALANHQFSDVPSSAAYHDFVDFLVDNGITSGCGPGLYCPGNAVTRAQMAIFLERVALYGGCSPDMVKVGPACIDKYEASVWEVAPGNTALIQKIRAGTATLAELQAGGIQRGKSGDDYGACTGTGGTSGCLNVYAVSIAGVPPSRFLTWFQATAAGRNSWKRLPTNAEWQAAALGTPDTGVCNQGDGSAAATGATASCVSHVGAFDMVGNVWEWVADWVPRSTTCVPNGWALSPFSLADSQCLAGAATDGLPGTLLRGGDFNGIGEAGVYAVTGLNPPTLAQGNVGFRAAR